MRIASFVLGLLLSLVVLGASLFAIIASGLAAIVGETATAESMVNSGMLGFFLSILGIIGASLAFKHKAASGILLSLTAAFLILVGTYAVHKNMILFGGLFFLAAIFAAVSKNEERPGKDKFLSTTVTEESSVIPKDEEMLDLLSGFRGLVEKGLVKEKFFEQKRDEILELKDRAAKTLTKKKPNNRIVREFLRRINVLKELISVSDSKSLIGNKHVKRLLKNL